MPDQNHINIPDPVREAASIICNGGTRPETPLPEQQIAPLERRLKQDIFDSLGRIKPEITATADFESDMMSGTLLAALPPALQGVAIARIEGALAFYNRVGWNPAFLHLPVERVIDDQAQLEKLHGQFHARTLHDLAYILPKHLNKLLGKTGATETWDKLSALAAEVASV